MFPRCFPNYSKLWMYKIRLWKLVALEMRGNLLLYWLESDIFWCLALSSILFQRLLELFVLSIRLCIEKEFLDFARTFLWLCFEIMVDSIGIFVPYLFMKLNESGKDKYLCTTEFLLKKLMNIGIFTNILLRLHNFVKPNYYSNQEFKNNSQASVNTKTFIITKIQTIPQNLNSNTESSTKLCQYNLIKKFMS